ncbi:baseplate J/gp47 family protein [Enterovibrio sp. ZSDZ35]|uniref:Baseplate J/gp47 family protein n=1 Tax=Enterovibrio qingdaonensis TaxID=2899818 RepID=A0ABT5QHM4_9GAMM|nr:baseplate J/gp47 family protein [Enterovibrio sp. ZSDZ35]MDD1780477.1 baseplate J/gp47 family protein [Enterovibrio sp. ZSDZ35]
MIYFCCDQRRREAVRQSDFNGIDFIEVIDQEALVEADRQRFLHLYLVNDPGVFVYSEDNLRIEGPNAIEIVSATMGLGGQTNVIVIEVAQPGDYSAYSVNLVTSPLNPLPPPEIDPALASVTFSFKVECATPFDCQSRCDCPEPENIDTDIDYTARDFYSFRRMMLDRLSVTAPAAASGHPADLSTALVDVLAYTADQLAYQQDAATTEAYLNKARSRISLKRMTRLVDYAIDEGCNARCFCHLAVSADVLPMAPATVVIPSGSAVCTQLSEQPRTFTRDDALLARSGAVYETCFDISALFAQHNEMQFYTWSNGRCHLPKGATQATLAGHFPELSAGMYLAFEEIIGARSGNRADRMLERRQVVLLAQVQFLNVDGEPLLDPVTEQEITEISWHGSDALRFPLCLSSETSIEEGREYIEPVSVARGNMVLVDHGQTLSGEQLPDVPLPTLSWAPGKGFGDQSTSGKGLSCADTKCEQDQAETIVPRYRPTLANKPLTFSPEYGVGAPASELLKTPEPDTTYASVSLSADDGVEVRPFSVVRDLLAVDESASVFTTEIERDGTVYLRFGDNTFGRRPLPETQFTATYRVGVGSVGHIGADKLYHLALPIPEVIEVRNITPGIGGRNPETNAEIRKRAPYLFKTQERAVTREDYQTLGRRVAGVQDVSCAYIHTGSWITTFALPDPEDRVEVSESLRTTLRNHYEAFRLAGHDVEVSTPVYVPLEVTLHVCVTPNASKSHVRQRLLTLFSSQRLPDGTLGLLHPDRFRAGETLHLSPWLAAAQNIEGVIAAKALLFRRFGDPRTSGLVDRELVFSRTEIARIDNDVSHPGNGVFLFDFEGGR